MATAQSRSRSASATRDAEDGVRAYLAEIAARGVRISIATDAHDINRLDGIHEMMEVLEGVGITREQLWTPEV